MENLNTVNVIEKTNENNLSVKSFNDTKEGNQEAENHFKTLLSEYGVKDVNFFIDEGYYNDLEYSIYLIHSI